MTLPLTKDQFLKKIAQEDTKPDPKCGNAVEIFTKLLEDKTLVPFGSPLESFLETLTKGVNTLGGGDELTDYGYELNLGNLASLKNALQKEDEDHKTVEKALRDLFMKQKVYSQDECYRALGAVNDFYEIGMDMDPKEGRSDKYKAIYDSIAGITEEQLNGLQDCDDPKKNGEELLQDIFDSTEKYQKGKSPCAPSRTRPAASTSPWIS